MSDNDTLGGCGSAGWKGLGPWGPVLRVVLYTGFLYGLGHLAMHTVPSESGMALFGEYGRLEMIQVAALGVGLLLALLAIVRHPTSRPIAVLIAGMLVTVLVREFNNYFKDHVADGLWQLIVYAVIFVSGALAFAWRAHFTQAAQRLVSSPAFGWMGAGVVVAIFAQLLDERSMWALVLEREDYPYAARRMAEESVELAAYALFTLGLIEYSISLARPSASTS